MPDGTYKGIYYVCKWKRLKGNKTQLNILYVELEITLFHEINYY